MKRNRFLLAGFAMLSIGMAIYSDYENLRDCLDAADKEMYAEKEQHKKEQ